MDTIFENMPERALDWHQAGKGAVLATVIQTWGSAPRRVGGQLVINKDCDMEGSVSGGCVEGAVVLEAIEALDRGERKVLEYGVSDADAFSVGLACGGTIRILLEPVGSALSVETLKTLVDHRARRVPIAYCVNVKTGESRLTSSEFEDRFRADKSGFLEDGETFIAIHNPPLRLIVVGAVHIAQALVPMARIAGFDPVIIEPRASFGSQARFPGVTIIEDWPDEAMEQIGVDGRTAVVLLTHDPKLDDPALIIALRNTPYYIGALGSKRTHAKRIERMSAHGFSETDIGRIHGPIGLDIGSATPSEIALSILAQMVQTLRRPS